MAATQPDSLKSLHRGEIAATETYNQALEKFAGQSEEAAVRRIRDEHREAANTLRQHVREQGDDPSQGSGVWGAWAKFVEGTAQAFGKTAALKALKEGEEHGIKEYEQALAEEGQPECRILIQNQLLPRCEAHVRTLEQLMRA